MIYKMKCCTMLLNGFEDFKIVGRLHKVGYASRMYILEHTHVLSDFAL
jgi:hypothetical protein